MSYTPIFDPDDDAARVRPRRDGAVHYVYNHDPDIALAVNVALAADRPLLLRGPPGCGKSSLAADVAHFINRRYEEDVVTSRTRAQDLQWRFDAVRRLADVQAGAVKEVGGERDAPYVDPGVLWRAFDGASAARHGRGRAAAMAQPDPRGVVVLIDEIDKADPDVPNDLLVVVDARWFRVAELDRVVRAPPDLELLLVITTNGERELPAAFVRRCVTFDMKTPERPGMKAIARRHFPDANDSLLDAILDALHELSVSARDAKLRPPSVAELLDAVRACERLNVRDVRSPQWTAVMEAAMWKHAPRRRAQP